MFFVNVRSSYVHERFWSMVEVVEKIRCWKWRGGKDAGGYGQFRMNGQTIRSPRVAFFYVMAFGRTTRAIVATILPVAIQIISLMEHVRTICATWFLREETNRSRGASRSRRSNNEKVLAIRAQYKEGLIGFGTLAKRFNCSPSTIQRVINRKNWAHV
jgi:hypothetical protein